MVWAAELQMDENQEMKMNSLGWMEEKNMGNKNLVTNISYHILPQPHLLAWPIA